MSLLLQRSHVQAILSLHLQQKSPAVLARLLPDAYIYGNAPQMTLESANSQSSSAASPPVSTAVKGRPLPPAQPAKRIAPCLLPAVRSLKWSIRRDSLARTMRNRASGVGADALLRWHGLWKEDERVRLAICPGVGKFVRYFEGLATK